MLIISKGMVMECRMAPTHQTSAHEAIEVTRCIGYHHGGAGIIGGLGETVFTWGRHGKGIKEHRNTRDAIPISQWNDNGHTIADCQSMSAYVYVPWTWATQSSSTMISHRKGITKAIFLKKWGSQNNELSQGTIEIIVGYIIGDLISAHMANHSGKRPIAL